MYRVNLETTEKEREEEKSLYEIRVKSTFKLKRFKRKRNYVETFE